MSDTNFQKLVEASDGLTSEFKQCAVDMFNQAVDSRVNDIKKDLTERAKIQRQQAIQTLTEKSVELLREEVQQRSEQLKQRYLSEIESLTQQIEQLQHQCQDLQQRVDSVNNDNQLIVRNLITDNVELAKQVARYADYVAEQYIDQHIDQITEAVEVSVAKSILSNIKSLFENFGAFCDQSNHSLYEKIETLTQERDDAYVDLAEAIESKLQLQQQLDESHRQEILDQVSSNLTRVQRIRLERLMEGDSSDIKSFKSRAKMLAESMEYRSSQQIDHSDVSLSRNSNIVTDQMPLMEDNEITTKPIHSNDVQYVLNALSRYSASQ